MTEQPKRAKRVGVIQSSYVPWRGYFDFIASVDEFVIYDDVQYSKGTWRNRNQVKTATGLKWLTVPVNARLEACIDEVTIGGSPKPWIAAHEGLLGDALRAAPCYKEMLELWREGSSGEPRFLSQLNVKLLRVICAYLDIRTPLLSSRDYALSGSKTERLLQLLKKLGATTYLSGPAAKDYLDEPQFAAAGIGLEYKSYNYPEYPQLHGAFIGGVTVLDLIANTGPDARELLRSTTPNVVAVRARA